MSTNATDGGGGSDRAALGALGEVPEAVKGAQKVIEGLDQCLLAGFGRLGAEQSAALGALERVFAATPLEKPLGEALGAFKSNEFQPRHFAVLAGARAALQGARFDALRAQAGAALGRTMEGFEQSGVPAAGAPSVLCDSARHWLMELAITGFKQLEASILAPFSATLENLQADPKLGRLASVLTGFQQELLAALPIGHASAIPVYRWADLWSAGMVASLQAERLEALLPAALGKVSGMLSVLGVDVRQHGCFVSAVVYGLLEGADEERLVRVTLSSYKVDALQGRQIWRCFGRLEGVLPLLRGISQHVPVKIKEMTLLATGDLLWDGAAAEGNKPGDVFATAARCLAAGAPTRFPTIGPADRHPVQLAELVYLAGVRVEGDKEAEAPLRVSVGEVALPVAQSRIIPGLELSREDVMAADTMLGLLRFDGGNWQIQPLAVKPGTPRDKKPCAKAFVGSDAYEVVSRKPKKGEPDTLAVLQERAGRLLRKKS